MGSPKCMLYRKYSTLFDFFARDLEEMGNQSVIKTTLGLGPRTEIQFCLGSAVQRALCQLLLLNSKLFHFDYESIVVHGKPSKNY